ncbi:MAG: HAD family phosphatase [Thermodesulfobacteriota bacterium]|nr:HAD family phosphatase [Thermodesulfobacteriota bacterium]
MTIIPPNTQALIFDFDGVLVDSVHVKAEAFASLFEQYGQDVVGKVVDYHLAHGGVTRREKFAYFYETFLGKSMDDTEMERLCRKFSQIVVDKVVAAPEIPGATDFLRQHHKTTPCFINSATPDEELNIIVERRGMQIYFKEVLGASRSKSENLTYIIKKFNHVPGCCTFFGDAQSDYDAALEAGVDFIAIIPDENAPLLKKNPGIEWATNFQQFS